MKDARFIELLNLYVDHQLTPSEARELEAELQAGPERRRTYQQYCRMQKACAQIFETERANAPATPRLARALADANRKITAHPFEPRHAAGFAPWATWRNIFAIGGLAAAAACVALIYVLRDPAPHAAPPAPAAAPAATIAATPAPPPATVPPPAETTTTPALATATVTPAPAENLFTLQTTLKRFRLPVVTSFAATTDTAVITVPALADDADLVWTKDIQMRSIRKVTIEDAISGLRRLEKPQIGAALFGIPAAETQHTTEMTAIEFKR